MEWPKSTLLPILYWLFYKTLEVIDLAAGFADNPARFGHAPRVFSRARFLFCKEY
jgi:hypothetical protein